MKIRLISILLLAAGWAHATDPVSLNRVILFNSGVGYFEREAVVDGDAYIRLSFPVEHVNDFIKSVVIIDEERGSPHLSLESRDPIERLLKTFPIDLSDNVSLPQLLEGIRGVPVRLTMTARTLEGRLISVERRVRQVDQERLTEHYVNLDTSEGLRAVSLDHVDQIQILDERLDADLKQALSVLAQRLDRQHRLVEARWPGENRRAVRIGYILEAPVWKTSYRLVLDDEDTIFLQGWAHVENMSDDDWEHVQLELVSGRPISFIQNLYDPIYVQRPVIDPMPDALQVPEEHDAALMRRERVEPESPLVMRGLFAGRAAEDRPERLREAIQVEAAAEAAPTGELFSYSVREPVTLARRRSAMIPIVQVPVEGRSLSLFNRSLNDRHPLNAVEMRNTSDLFLMRGPLTVFEADLYAGEGLLPPVPPGERQLLSYAVDLAMEIHVEQDTRPRRIESVNIVHGVMHLNHRQEWNFDYRVRNKREHERRLILEHPRRRGWGVSGPHDDPESTRDAHRFEIEVPASESRTYRVTDHRITHESVELVNLPHERIRIFLRQEDLPDRIRDVMKEIAGRQMEIVEIQRDISNMEKEIQDINRDQARIREHMRVIDRTSDAFRKWQSQLIEQEEEIQKLHQRLRDAREKEKTKQGELDQYMTGLNVE